MQFIIIIDLRKCEEISRDLCNRIVSMQRRAEKKYAKKKQREGGRGCPRHNSDTSDYTKKLLFFFNTISSTSCVCLRSWRRVIAIENCAVCSLSSPSGEGGTFGLEKKKLRQHLTFTDIISHMPLSLTSLIYKLFQLFVCFSTFHAAACRWVISWFSIYYTQFSPRRASISRPADTHILSEKSKVADVFVVYVFFGASMKVVDFSWWCIINLHNGACHKHAMEDDWTNGRLFSHSNDNYSRSNVNS